MCLYEVTDHPSNVHVALGIRFHGARIRAWPNRPRCRVNGFTLRTFATPNSRSQRAVCIFSLLERRRTGSSGRKDTRKFATSRILALNIAVASGMRRQVGVVQLLIASSAKSKAADSRTATLACTTATAALSSTALVTTTLIAGATAGAAARTRRSLLGHRKLWFPSFVRRSSSIERFAEASHVICQSSRRPPFFAHEEPARAARQSVGEARP